MSESIDSQLERIQNQKSNILEALSDIENENEKINKQLTELKVNISDIEKEIILQAKNGVRTDALESELSSLERKKNELCKLREKNNDMFEKLNKDFFQLDNEISELSGKATNSKHFVENIISNVVTTPVSFISDNIKETVKFSVSKINPINKKINKADVADTGVESLRLANSSVKVVKSSIKTTKKTIKTTGKTFKRTGTVVYKSASFTLKAAIKTFKITEMLTMHIIAFLINPIVLIFCGLLIIITSTTPLIALLIGGGASSATTNGQAQAGAVGLIDVPTQYQSGIEIFDSVVNSQKNEFNNIIDSMYYDYNDLSHSDIVYMEYVGKDLSKIMYEKSFVTNEEKDILKNAWSFPISEQEAVALAYIYLEKQQNDVHGTVRQIYEVKYTKEVFNTIVSKCLSFIETTYPNQFCPNKICSAHIYDNPDYQSACNNANISAGAFNDWGEIISYIEQYNLIHNGAAQTAYWNNNIQWRIDNWKSVYSSLITVIPYYTDNGNDFLNYLGTQYEYYNTILKNTPEQIIEHKCDQLHNLHSISLVAYTADIVMNSLGFSEADKQWYELTKQGFASNPNI